MNVTTITEIPSFSAIMTFDGWILSLEDVLKVDHNTQLGVSVSVSPIHVNAALDPLTPTAPAPSPQTSCSTSSSRAELGKSKVTFAYTQKFGIVLFLCIASNASVL